MNMLEAAALTLPKKVVRKISCRATSASKLF